MTIWATIDQSDLWSHQWQLNHFFPCEPRCTDKGTSQLGQFIKYPQFLQLKKPLCPLLGIKIIACSFLRLSWGSNFNNSLEKIFIFPFLNSSRISIILISGISLLDILWIILTNLKFFSKIHFFQVFIDGVALPKINFAEFLFTISIAISLAS